ncbi:Conserved hypothetical protein [Bradyrhizobium sp. ORS 278]|uniref:hypothetical protein n=1 Tax=Bradyrhizobium sp. (strain ORS 278) TaxID=114615 RepID=UPI0001508873|nr:hypothetical protein [Bradyrhizobium sp. ORS 278]CAL77601.1 Conserved hypothetical protein [Bradyrhizobium sp. ORS 278]
MSVQSTPKEVDPGDVALSPENDICEQIYQRVLTEVRARIDQRIAAIEAQAAAEAEAEMATDAVDIPAPLAAAESATTPTAARRRPVLRAAITLAASAGLVGAVVTLARDHQEAITSVTDRIEGAIQSIRREAPQMAMPTGTREPAATSGAGAADNADAAPASSVPSASPSPEPPSGRSSDPSSAMADATSERDMPPAPERDLAPLIEKIAHDVAALQTGLQDLKASQEQASRDQAKAIEQLQASQDQLARAVRAAKTEPTTTVGAAARLAAPRPPQQVPARAPRFPNF